MMGALVATGIGLLVTTVWFPLAVAVGAALEISGTTVEPVPETPAEDMLTEPTVTLLAVGLLLIAACEVHPARPRATVTDTTARVEKWRFMTRTILGLRTRVQPPVH